MEAIILNTTAFPAQVRNRINTPKVRVAEQDGTVILFPCDESTPTRPTKLFGMFAGTSMSTDAYMAQKQIDKRLE